MRTGHHLRCDRCHASCPTRDATLTPSAILCPACAALLRSAPSPVPASAAPLDNDDTTGRRSPPPLPQKACRV